MSDNSEAKPEARFFVEVMPPEGGFVSAEVVDTKLNKRAGFLSAETAKEACKMLNSGKRSVECFCWHKFSPGTQEYYL